MYRYFINREWMISPNARRTYRSAAKISLAFLIVIFCAPFLPIMPAALDLVWHVIVIAGVLSSGLVMVAMEYFLFGFDTSSDMRKVVSFVWMLLPILGCATYCLTVYARLTASALKSDDAGLGASA